MNTTRLLLPAVLLALVAIPACSKDDAAPLPESGIPPEAGAHLSEQGTNPADGSTASDRGTVTPPPDTGTSTDGQPPSGEVGSVCTQQNKTCGAGLRCVFLEAWNAPKGTCVRELADGCRSWDDPRCVVPSKNYSVMCGPYTENSTTTNICFLLCEFNSVTFDCPPQHGCKLVNTYQVCLPN